MLGNEALRDARVQGESLRLVVMEGVPWPRPTVLHSARRAASGGTAYDDRVVRARLGQAFGRLIRRENDRGMLVILSAAMPSRLLSAFPAEVTVRRLPLDQAIAQDQSALSLAMRSALRRSNLRRRGAPMKRLTCCAMQISGMDRWRANRSTAKEGPSRGRTVGQEMRRWGSA